MKNYTLSIYFKEISFSTEIFEYTIYLKPENSKWFRRSVKIKGNEGSPIYAKNIITKIQILGGVDNLMIKEIRRILKEKTAITDRHDQLSEYQGKTATISLSKDDIKKIKNN